MLMPNAAGSHSQKRSDVVQTMGIESVLKRFPDRADAILRIAAADPLFSSLCDDYQLCMEAMIRFEAYSTAAPRRADEYRQLALELEAEILDRLMRCRS